MFKNKKSIIQTILVILLSVFSLIVSMIVISTYAVVEDFKVKEYKIIPLEEFETMKQQISSLKRVQNALLKYDEEHWSRYVKEQKEKGNIVFPRMNHECPDTMIHASLKNGTGAALVANTCEIEAHLWETN